METEYFWWDLDKSRFKGVLYDSINVYFLHDHQYQNWDEFAAADPHIAYAHLTYVRFNALEQQFVDLRVIPQLLGVAPVPVKSSVKDINRYDWLKSISDLALFRFSSLRDIAFHFVNETMELGVPERKVNMRSVSRVLFKKTPAIVKHLETISDCGARLRAERNQRAHEGTCNLYTDDDQLFKNMSWAEESGGQIHGYDVVQTYSQARDRLYHGVVTDVAIALKATLELVDGLYEHYRDRHYELSKMSRSGVSQHFHLHCDQDS